MAGQGTTSPFSLSNDMLQNPIHLEGEDPSCIFQQQEDHLALLGSHPCPKL
jgi:hypothetical protein